MAVWHWCQPVVIIRINHTITAVNEIVLPTRYDSGWKLKVSSNRPGPGISTLRQPPNAGAMLTWRDWPSVFNVASQPG